MASLSDGTHSVREFVASFEPPQVTPRFVDLQFFQDRPNLLLEGTQNSTYTIYHSSNMVDWQELKDVTVTGPVADILDLDAPEGLHRRMYKAEENVVP